MTLLEINLTDVLSETDPDDVVIVWAPVMREGPAGQLVGPRRKSIPLTNGVGSDEVVPGPLMVQVQCKAMSDTRPREVVVPEEGPVTLTGLLDSAGAFTYAPPVVGQVALDAQRAEDAAVRAEAGAAVVGDAQTAIITTRDQAVTAVSDAGTAATTAITTARDQAVTAAQTTTAHVQSTTEDAARAETAATTAEMWAAGMADAVLTESPPGSGLYLFGGQTITEDPANDGLYLIGA